MILEHIRSISRLRKTREAEQEKERQEEKRERDEAHGMHRQTEKREENTRKRKKGRGGCIFVSSFCTVLFSSFFVFLCYFFRPNSLSFHLLVLFALFVSLFLQQ